MRIRAKKLHPDAVLPQYAHGSEEDAGMDLRAVERVVLVAGGVLVAPACVHAAAWR